jgi:hypothetical protein
MESKFTDDTPRLQTQSREAFWQRHVSQWRESDLSIMAYCQQYSLIYHQMVCWCSKAKTETGDVKCVSNDFIAVSVTPVLTHSALSIRLPNGIVIEGIDELSVALIGRLVEQL